MVALWLALDESRVANPAILGRIRALGKFSVSLHDVQSLREFVLAFSGPEGESQEITSKHAALLGDVYDCVSLHFVPDTVAGLGWLAGGLLGLARLLNLLEASRRVLVVTLLLEQRSQMLTRRVRLALCRP